jgi:hypothetical protein
MIDIYEISNIKPGYNNINNEHIGQKEAKINPLENRYQQATLNAQLLTLIRTRRLKIRPQQSHLKPRPTLRPIKPGQLGGHPCHCVAGGGGGGVEGCRGGLWNAFCIGGGRFAGVGGWGAELFGQVGGGEGWRWVLAYLNS